MLTARISMSGSPQKLGESIRAAVTKNAEATAAEMTVEVKQTLSVPAQSANGKTESSAPFTAPRMRTGKLRDSVGFTVEGNGSALTMQAGTFEDAPYARQLEFGTAHMLPRPFLIPALVKYAKVLADRVKAVCGEAR